MTFSNDELVRRFVNGRSSGKACNMEIKELHIDGEKRGTILIDYGWAILAHRTKFGTITLFDKWYGYSQTTSTHINKVRSHADRVNEEVHLTYAGRNGSDNYDNYMSPSEWDGFPFDSELEQKIHEVIG